MSMLSRGPGSSGGMDGHFPDPFIDVATLSMPQSMKNALQWSEYIWSSFSTYGKAMERVVSYLITDLEYGNGEASDDEQEKWTDLLQNTMGILGEIKSTHMNRACYGNSFTSLLVPFKRFLGCPGERCGAEFTLRIVHDTPLFAFKWQDYGFFATCPYCKRRGRWRVIDRPDNIEKKLKIKHWNPHEIEILHDYLNDETAYMWRIPEDYKNQVRRGYLFNLENVSLPVIEAIRRNQMFRFNDEVIYHMKEPTLAGLRNRGWGLPRLFTSFRQVYYVQVLRRFNEAIALDYVIPFRLLTPAPGRGGDAASSQASDPILNYNLRNFSGQMRAMLRRRRRDPAAWNVLPFPVQYQMLGGDANKLAPKDLLDQGYDQLLNDSGVPVELYKGTMQLQSAPVALRLFEALWSPLGHDTNAFLKWLVRQIAQILNWEPVDARMRRITIADDVAKQMAQLQLMMGQQISGTTGLKGMGLDWKSEQKQLAAEAEFQAQEQAKMQEEMQQQGFAQQIAQGQGAAGPAAAQGAPSGAGGGAAPQGAGNAPAASPGQAGAPGQGPVDQWLASQSGSGQTPQQMISDADSLAQSLLGLPESIKDSQLRLLKNKNEVMAAVVKARLTSIRQKARNQGGAQVLAAQFGQGGQGAAQ